MSDIYDDHDQERDWPEEHPHAGETTPPAAPESEDDAARLPPPYSTRRRPPGRRRGSYRPPSELDHD